MGFDRIDERLEEHENEARRAAELEVERALSEVQEALHGPQLRPFVRKVAEAMEERLRANRGKDGLPCGRTFLLEKLVEEVAELVAVAKEDEDPACIEREAADVANIAGMLAVASNRGTFVDWREPLS